MGRPTVLTKSVIKRLADAIASGQTHASACREVGIARSSFQKWLSDAEGSDDPLLIQLSDAITRARASAESEAVSKIRSSDDWRAASWWLTHHPATRETWSDAAAQRKAEDAVLAEVVRTIETEFATEPDTRHRLFTALAAAGFSRQGENSNEEA